MLTRRNFLSNALASTVALAAGSTKPEAARITLRPEPTWLDELVGRLSQESGQPLAVETSCQWDGLMASVKERPVAKVREDLTELFHLAWTDDPSKPVLSSGLRVRNLEQSLRARMYAASADRMGAYASLVSRPPEFFAALKEARAKNRLAEEPLLRNVEPELFQSPAHRLAIALWGTFTRDQTASIFAASSHRVYLPWREMSVEQRKIARALAEECENPAPGLPYLAVKPTPHSVELAEEFGVVVLGWNWELGRSSHVKYAEVYRTRPPLHLANNLDMRPETLQGKANRGNPYVLSPSDPRGERGYSDLERIPFPAKGFRQNYPMAWADTFRQLADRLPFALYSDYFTGKSVGVDNSATPREESGNPAILPLESMRVAEVLDALCSRVGQVWWRKGDAIFFRSRSWYIDRQYQAPRDVLASCQKQLTEKERLDVEMVDRLAALTWQELGGIDDLAREESDRAPFRAYFGFYHALYRLLKVYAGLKSEDRESALAAGIPADRVGLSLRRQYQEALFIHDADPEVIANPPPLRFEQRTIKGIPKRRPNLCQIRYAPKANTPEYEQEVIACHYIPYPLKDSGAML